MNPKNLLSRLGAVLLSPIALIVLVLVPALAAGAYHTTRPSDPDEITAVNSGASGSTSSADPLARSRAALTNTTLPLGLLTGGMQKLTDGGVELDDGAHQLSDGLHQARGGSEELADGMTQLQSGLWQIGDGSSQVSGGVDEVVGSLTGLGAIQGQVELIVQQTMDSLATSQDPAAVGALDQLRTVQDMLRTNGLGSDVLARLQQLKEGANTLAYQLDDPASDFVSGFVRATDGSAQLRDGLVKLDDGGNRLVDGTGQLVDGTAPMSGVLSTVQNNVAAASSSLPPANRIAADPVADLGNPDPAPTTYVVRPAFPDWPYLLGALAVVACVAIVTVRRTARFPALAVVGVVATAVGILVVLRDGLSWGNVAIASGVLAAWAVAYVAAARAVLAIAGRRIGGLVVLAGTAVQLVIVGLAGADFWYAGTHAASFLPVGQLAAALGETAVAGAGTRTVVSAVVALATVAVSAAVTSAHRSAGSPETETVAEKRDEPATVS